MSRFFDALREANRSVQDSIESQQQSAPLAEQGATREEWGVLETDQAGFVPAPPPQKSPPTEPDAEPDGRDAAGGAWDPISEQLFQSFDTPKAELAGTSAKVSLDRTARLIPNTLDPTVIEHYRRLRTKIMQQQSAMPFRSMVVTSPNPQEGKSVTVMNLGLSLGMLPDYKVLIVDGDLRRGSLGRWLGVEDQPGLSNLVEGSATVEDTIYKCEDRALHFLLRGTSEELPGELLQSPQLNSLFSRLAESFDLVLVDSPPVNLMTDAQLLAGACDGVLLVARAYSTSRKAFEKAVQDLRPFRMIGTVLNGGARTRLGSRYKGYYFNKE